MMLDACGLVVSKEHGQDLGKQKMWANCAFVIAPLITGCLVDVISDYRGDIHHHYTLWHSFEMIYSYVVQVLGITQSRFTSAPDVEL